MSDASYVLVAQLAAIVAAHRAERGADACVAFVLAPGGAAGAYQAGALQALGEAGIKPDLVIGTSSGALNGLALVLDALATVAWKEPPTPRLRQIWRRISHPDLGSRLVLDKPELVAWLAGRPAANAGLTCLAIGRLSQLGATWAELKAGIFSARPLRTLLRHAIGSALDQPSETPGLAGRSLTQAWASAHAAGTPAPTLVVLTTDAESHEAVPFVLGDVACVERLISHRHPARHLGEGVLSGAPTIDAFMASAAIPGAFPTVLMPADRPGWAPRPHLDGAIAASEPFHIAIDAGATLLVSLEVSPYAHPPRPDAGGDRSLVETAADALMAIQERYLRADARAVALRNQVPARRVPLFRLAPSRRAIGLFDFDGHYVHGQRALSLFDWYMEGYADAGGDDEEAGASYVRNHTRLGDMAAAENRSRGPGFWDATDRYAPGHPAHSD